MNAGIDSEIRDRLSRYLSGETAWRDFEDWFVSATWDIEKSGNSSAIELTHEIELRFAEFSNGHRTESDLHAKLRPLLESCVPQSSSPSNR